MERETRSLLPLISVVLLLLAAGFVLGVLLAPRLPIGPASRGSSQDVLIITVPVAITSTPGQVAPVSIAPATLPAANTGPAQGTPDDAVTQEVRTLPIPVSSETEGLPASCIRHAMRAGETPYGVALTYGVDLFEMLGINGLDEVTARYLLVGDVLIVPLAGCDMTAGEVRGFLDGEWTIADRATTTPDATITLPPTADSVQVEIARVVGSGDLSAEGIEIRNNGDGIDLDNWTIEDRDGNRFTFPQQRLFATGQVMVFTRSGENTPNALYWGAEEALWGDADEIATLRDAGGSVQATLRLAGETEEATAGPSPTPGATMPAAADTPAEPES